LRRLASKDCFRLLISILYYYITDMSRKKLTFLLYFSLLTKWSPAHTVSPFYQLPPVTEGLHIF